MFSKSFNVMHRSVDIAFLWYVVKRRLVRLNYFDMERGFWRGRLEMVKLFEFYHASSTSQWQAAITMWLWIMLWRIYNISCRFSIISSTTFNSVNKAEFVCISVVRVICKLKGLEPEIWYINSLRESSCALRSVFKKFPLNFFFF